MKEIKTAEDFFTEAAEGDVYKRQLLSYGAPSKEYVSTFYKDKKGNLKIMYMAIREND